MSRDRVKLSDVRVLTLRRGMMTKGRRSSPIEQMTCVGRACAEFEPDAMQCQNTGWDGVSTQWKCEADLPEGIYFSSTTVSCEGYDYPDDPYILYGSCGVEYVLEGTRKSRYGNGDDSSSHYDRYPYRKQTYSDSYDYSRRRSTTKFSTQLYSVLFLAALVYLVYYCWKKRNRENGFDTRRGPGSGGGGGGGWGGGDDGDDSYTNQTDPSGKNIPTARPVYPQNIPRAAAAPMNAGFGGGNFWGGLRAMGIGGMLGYMMRGAGRRHGWGGGGYGYGYRNRRAAYTTNRFAQRPRARYRNSNFGGGSYSGGGVRRAAGFGGTRRR